MTGPTAAELATVVRLVVEHQAVLVNVGHGHDPHSIACANAFVEVWQAGGGEIGTIVSWPAVAASWLRPACRFAAGAPDAWVVADCPTGRTGFGRRLAAAASWRAQRTVAFSWLAEPDVAGAGRLRGNGRPARCGGGRLIVGVHRWLLGRSCSQ